MFAWSILEYFVPNKLEDATTFEDPCHIRFESTILFNDFRAKFEISIFTIS